MISTIHSPYLLVNTHEHILVAHIYAVENTYTYTHKQYTHINTYTNPNMTHTIHKNIVYNIHTHTCKHACK